MKTIFRGTADETAQDMRAAGLQYFVELGRRAPMHRMHVDCILEGIRAGLRPVIFIGSTNGADSPLYDPVRNPLTVDQQKEQFRIALPGLYYNEGRIITLNDTGDEGTWLQSLRETIDEAGYGGKSVIHFRSKAADAENVHNEIKPLSTYTQSFIDAGLAVWQSYNHDVADDHISATDIRAYDLEHLSPEQKDIIATPDYLVSIAKAARNSNPDKSLLERHGIPLTVLDLTFDRLRKEAAIDTVEIIEKAQKDTGVVTRETLAQAAIQIVRSSRSVQPHFSASAQSGKEFQLKIASASCNQTAGDWPHNLKNICKAIDKAVEDGADILCLEELGLTGYERGDDFYYTDNTKTREMLQLIADYTASKNPDLIISVGHPWRFADKDIPDQAERRRSPLFNRINNPFNVQTLITGGEIISMSAKRYLFNYERGYEKRHFEEWSDVYANRYSNQYGKGRSGTIMIEIPGMKYTDGTVLPPKIIPFGSPVIQFGQGDKTFNVNHVICEEYWIGSRFDGSADNGDYDRDNPLAQKARHFDITVAINPNASPPAPGKIEKHYELCKLASNHAGVLVHTDGLGSSGSTFALFGSRLMAQGEKIISEGCRLSFQDVAYTSQIVLVKPPIYKGHRPHALIAHTVHENHTAPIQDGPAPWEGGSRREFEEELRNEILWQFDYERKNKLNGGIVEALSGGKDSCYNSVIRAHQKVELVCRERGIEGYLEAMGNPPYKAEILDILGKQGEKAAKRAIMDRTLTCVFMGTNNSDEGSLKAARTLIEGGTMEDGTSFEGIGGKFIYCNVQRLLDVYAEIYAGVNPDVLENDRENEIRRELADILRLRPEDIAPEDLSRRVEEIKSKFEEVTHEILSFANPKHQIAYENIQARMRQVLIMAFSNVENKLAIANPNRSEMVNSYATFGGDLHSGMVSGNAHKGKAREIEHLHLLYQHGLDGLEPVKALHYTLQQAPSAGLQPLDKEGKVTQFDEDQLGRSFEQIEIIEYFMLHDRPLSQDERKNNPTEVYEKCRQHPLFRQDNIETLHDRIHVSYEKWGGNNQAKIHAGPIALTYGKNVDHQSSLRTPNISANQRPEQAQMTLYCLNEIAKRDGLSFEDLTGGHTLAELSSRALVDESFNARLLEKMWVPGATDGRKMKIDALYACMCRKEFGPVAASTEMSGILAQAMVGRKHSVPSPG